MTKLEDLINKLCPDGVVYRRLCDISKMGAGDRITKSMMHDNYQYPVMGAGVVPTGYYTNWNRENTITIARAGVGAGIVGWHPERFWATDVCFTVDDDKTGNVNIKYLYYVVKAQEKNRKDHIYGGSMPKIDKNYLWHMQIPVPPLEIQNVIARILDNFTELTAELTTELTTELTARKKQYEYYRDKLLTLDYSIPIVALKDIATSMYRGSGIKKDQVTSEGIPCVRYGEIYTIYNTSFQKCISHTKLEFVQSPKYFEYGDVLFAITGENVDDIAKSTAYLGNEKCLAGGDIVVMKHTQNPRYLAHVLNTTMAKEQKSKGKVKSKVVHSSIPSLEQIKIPLPSLDIQERFANVLDNFEAIYSDLSIGLPAEIESRQKQYEFYRDQLLTFIQTGHSILTDRQTDRQTESN